jgi:membrane-bound lytic murein transglycosylase A
MIPQTFAAAGLLLMIAGTTMADTTFRLLTFDALDDWADDDHQAALEVFLNTCGDFDDPDWRSLCEMGSTIEDARTFFEHAFQPVLIDDGQDPLFTGYYEPELQGALEQGGPFQYPLYALPDEVQPGTAWLTRQEIEETDALADRGLEIAWIDDPVDVFFLQVQGSGRVRLPDGNMIRVGYGGKNGHEYSSVGAELVRQGVYQEHQVSAQVIRNWVRNNPEEGRALLWTNQSYVFFREVSEVPADRGPLGAMNRSITELRSIAVDPAFIPLGAPVWIEKEGATPMRRLMVAQDTGSAIRGAQRADVFFGTGQRAGRAAGRVRDGGRLVVLLPIQRAYALLTETIE